MGQVVLCEVFEKESLGSELSKLPLKQRSKWKCSKCRKIDLVFYSQKNTFYRQNQCLAMANNILTYFSDKLHSVCCIF